MRSNRNWLPIVVPVFLVAALAVGCGGGEDSGPKATATPKLPGPEDALGSWVRDNRNVAFVGDCAKAEAVVDVGKLCAIQIGERGTLRAYSLGPTFSEPTALAMLEETPRGWVVLSVTNRDPSQGDVPGLPWPLGVGDSVVMIGLGEGDCLRIREQPTQQGKQLACMPDGTTAIIQEGPVDAETITWWRISGEGFSGWAAGRWLRLPEAIADALNPQPAATATPVD